MDFELLSSEKTNFKFNEISSISGVKPYVLRFWESEFDQINPIVAEDGHKIYSKQDLENIKRIKSLLFDDKLSIPEAKKKITEELSQPTVNETPTEPMISGIATHGSSLEMMRNALELDFTKHKQAISQKQFNDDDVLNLIQAKKKLSSVLGKINTIVKDKNW